MVGSVSLTANGIYLPNSPNSSFTNNTITVAGEWGIFAENNFASIFDNNTINGATYVVRAENCDSCSFNNNDINNSNGETDFGITAHSSPGISLNNNTIIADEQGIYVDSSPNATITNNHITGRIYWNGIMFGSSDSSLVQNNHVERTISNESNNSWQYLVYGGNSEGSIIRSNSLIYPNIGQNRGDNQMALRCEWSIVDSNYIEFYFRRYSDHYAIYDDRNSDITNNIINSSSYTNNNTNHIIHSNTSDGYVNTIEGNTINHDHQGYERFQYAIWTQSNSIVRNNTISTDDMEHAIYVQDNCIVENNEISGHYNLDVIEIYGSDVSVYNNSINQTGGGEVIWVNGYNGIEIYDNTANITSGAKFLGATASEVSVHHKLIQTNTGIGIEIYNQSGGDIYNNTLISNSGDYGVYIHNLTELPVRNNIIVGFQNGIRDDNDLANTNLRYNDMFDSSGSQYLGTGLPVMIGQYVSENDNGDPIDIYGNMNLDPSFALPSEGNYELQLISPCINAGDPSLYRSRWYSIRHRRFL